MANPLKTKFFKNVMKVAGGAAAGQVILLLASPFITRIFGAEIFGVWGIFNSVALIVTPVASLCYVTAIVLPDNEPDARIIARLSVAITTGVAILATIFFLVLGPQTRQWFSGVGDSWHMFPLVGAFVLIGSSGEIARQLLIRREKFGSVALATTATSSFTAVAQLGGGLLLPTAIMLIGSNVVAKAADAIVKWGLYIRASRNDTRTRATFADYKKMAYLHRGFPIFKAPQTLVDALAKSLPIILLGGFFGAASAGFYTICRTTLLLPNNLIGNAISDVFYPRISRARKTGEKLYPLVLKATLLAATVGAIPVVVLVFFGPSLFALVFGAEWRIAGEYAQWLSLMTWGMMMNSPAIQAIQVLTLQRAHLFFTIGSITFRIGAMLTLILVLGSDVLGVAAYGLASVVATLLLILWILRKCRKFDQATRAQALE